MGVSGTVGNAIPIVMVLEDGNELVHPQARIYAQGATTPSVILDLVHKEFARYEADFTPVSVGTYSAVFVVYDDIGHTTESIVYTREAEQILVTQDGIDDLAGKLLRILGLVHENAFIDNTVHDAFGSLVAARVRIFDSKANVDAATDGGSETTGLVATYEIDASFEANCRLGTYRMKKV
jgi:hypothetical protein